MAIVKRRHLPTLIAIVATLALAIWRGFAGDPLTDAVEQRLLDARFLARGPWAQIDDTVLVAVDEAAANRFGGQAELRSALAQALPIILAAEPDAVAIDLVFAEATPADALLAAALASDERIVIAAAALNEITLARSVQPELRAALDRSAIPLVVGRPGAIIPHGALLPAPALASAARVAHVNLVRTPDGAARAVPLALPMTTGHALPSLPLAAVAIAKMAQITLFCGVRVVTGNRSMPVDTADRIIIDHVGERGAIPTVSLLDVLEGAVPISALRDKIVFIGATAESLGDMFATPFAQNVSGVEVLAGIASGLLRGRAIQRNDLAIAITIFLAMTLGGAVAAAHRLPTDALVLAATGGLWVIGLVGLQIAFARHSLWLDAVAVVGALAFGTTIGRFGRYQRAAGDAHRFARERTNLAKYVAPDLAEQLARDGSPGFHRRGQAAAILFIDVAGFTTFAEQASNTSLTNFLSALHCHFERVSAKHQGVIVDFQGDGAMIVFGLPEASGDDARRAISCAIELLRDQNWRSSASDAPLALRASAHYGQVVAAVLGGARQAVVTLAGDTVNLAARLQETAKAEGRTLAASREILDAAHIEDGQFERLTVTRVRGRAQPTEVWALIEES